MDGGREGGRERERGEGGGEREEGRGREGEGERGRKGEGEKEGERKRGRVRGRGRERGEGVRAIKSFLRLCHPASLLIPTVFKTVDSKTAEDNNNKHNNKNQ